MCTNRSRYKTGFTLAEVLITLTVIGVLASLTIPNLMNYFDNMQTVTQLKKVNVTLAAATSSLVADYGGDLANSNMFSSGNTAQQNALNVIDAYESKLKFLANCGNTDYYNHGTGTATCWPILQTKYLNAALGSSNLHSGFNYGRAILLDGTLFHIYPFASDCNGSGWGAGIGVLKNSTCGQITVDLNGAKPPNQFGRDIFCFYITRNNIYPLGAVDSDPGKKDCAISSYGYGCAGKVLTENAINY